MVGCLNENTLKGIANTTLTHTITHPHNHPHTSSGWLLFGVVVARVAVVTGVF